MLVFAPDEDDVNNLERLDLDKDDAAIWLS